MERARFNIIEAANEGYRLLWQERRVLTHLALLPVVIKVAIVTGIMSFGMESAYLRQGLFFLPCYFLEGWLAAVAIQLAYRGPMLRQDGFFANRDLMACVALYVLAQLAANFLAGFTMQARRMAPAEPPAAMADDPTLLPVAFLVLALTLWAFRFLWLYVPAALGYRLHDFVYTIRRFFFSFYILGFYMLCFIPFALALMLCARGLATVFPDGGGDLGFIYILMLAFARAVCEICILLVSALGFAWAVRQVMEGREAAR